MRMLRQVQSRRFRLQGRHGQCSSFVPCCTGPNYFLVVGHEVVAVKRKVGIHGRFKGISCLMPLKRPFGTTFWLTEGHIVRYAQDQDKIGFFTKAMTALPLLGLSGSALATFAETQEPSHHPVEFPRQQMCKTAAYFGHDVPRKAHTGTGYPLMDMGPRTGSLFSRRHSRRHKCGSND